MKYTITLNSQSPRIYTVESPDGASASYLLNDGRLDKPSGDNTQAMRAAMMAGLRAEPQDAKSGADWEVECE